MPPHAAPPPRDSRARVLHYDVGPRGFTTGVHAVSAFMHVVIVEIFISVPVRPTNQFDEHASSRICWHGKLNKVQIFARVPCKLSSCARARAKQYASGWRGRLQMSKEMYTLHNIVCVFCVFASSFFYVSHHNKSKHKTVMEIMFTCLSALEHNRHIRVFVHECKCAPAPE